MDRDRGRPVLNVGQWPTIAAYAGFATLRDAKGAHRPLARPWPRKSLRYALFAASASARLLANPEDACHPGDVALRKAAAGRAAADRLEFDLLTGLTHQLLGQQIAAARLDDDAIA